MEKNTGIYSMVWYAGGILLLIFGAVGMIEWRWSNAQTPSGETVAVPTPNAEFLDFKDLDLSARAAYVYDMRTKRELFSYNADAQLPLASLSKLMAALIARDTLSAETDVRIDESALAAEGDSGLSAGERWRVGDLINFALITSSNDAITALASAIEATPGGNTVYRMNTKARQMGLQQTYFLTPTGLDVSDEQYPGAVGSARDIAHLMAAIVTVAPDMIRATTEAAETFWSVDGNEHKAKNTNTTIETIPGMLASKTGFTDLAGGNLAVTFNAGLMHPIVVVVLGSVRDEREQDVKTLIHATLAALASYN